LKQVYAPGVPLNLSSCCSRRKEHKTNLQETVAGRV